MSGFAFAPYMNQGQKAPRLEPGDAWPPLLADSACLCEKYAVAPCQLNHVWAFRGKAFPRVKARTYLWTACYTHPSCTTRWGIGVPVPHQHLHTAAGLAAVVTAAVPLGEAWGTRSLARPVDGPPVTALGLRPRTVKRMHPEGEST